MDYEFTDNDYKVIELWLLRYSNTVGRGDLAESALELASVVRDRTPLPSNELTAKIRSLTDDIGRGPGYESSR